MSAQRRSPRSPRERAEDEARRATQRYQRKAEQLIKAEREVDRLRSEAEELQADADFWNSHPLLKH